MEQKSSTTSGNLLKNEGINSNVDGFSDVSEYSNYLHLVFSVILLVYIPIIIVSSSFVVSAVILLIQLHKPHHIILLAISLADIAIAVVCIPIQVITTMENIEISNDTRLILGRVQSSIDTTSLLFLTFLGLDTFFQIKYPHSYKRYNSTKKSIVLMIVIAVIEFCIEFAYFGINMYLGELEYNKTPIKYLLLYFHQVEYLILFSLCCIFGVAVRWISWKTLQERNERITMMLLMMYVIFYIPTVVYLIRYDYMGSEESMNLQSFASVSRYLSSVTNGFFIYLSRPLYTKAFRYFIKTNPIHWKNVKRLYGPKYSIYQRPKISTISDYSDDDDNPDGEVNVTASLLINESLTPKNVENLPGSRKLSNDSRVSRRSDETDSVRNENKVTPKLVYKHQNKDGQLSSDDIPLSLKLSPK